jgi:hypothetical protein
MKPVVTLHNVNTGMTIASYLDCTNFMFINIGDLPSSYTISIDHNPLRKAPLVVFSVFM